MDLRGSPFSAAEVATPTSAARPGRMREQPERGCVRNLRFALAAAGQPSPNRPVLDGCARYERDSRADAGAARAAPPPRASLWGALSGPPGSPRLGKGALPAPERRGLGLVAEP